MTAAARSGPPAPQAPVPSPCVNVCRMSPASGLCEGCLRTIEEIAAWSQMSEAGKRVVWARLEARRAVAVPGAPAQAAAGGRPAGTSPGGSA